MAINSQISIGKGIGLQGSPEMYENIAMEQLRYKRKKEDEAKAREKELLDKYRGSLSVAGYDPIYNKQISASAAKIIDRLNKAQSEKRLNTIESDPEFRKDFADFQVLSGNAKVMTQAIAQGLKESSDISNQGMATPNKDLFDKLNAARTAGDVTPELAAYFGEGGMGVDPTKFYNIKEPDINYQERVAKVFSPFTEAKAKAGGVATFDEATGKIVTPRTKTYTLADAENIIRQDLRNPDIARQAVKDFNKLSESERASFGDPESYYIKTYAPQLTVSDYQESLSFKGDGGGVTKIQIQNSFETPSNVITDSAGKRSRAPEVAGVYGVVDFGKKIKPTMPTLPSGAVDASTGQMIKSPITDPETELGSPAQVPIINRNFGSLKKGELLTSDRIKSALKDKGVNILDSFEYSPMAFQSSKTRKPVLDKGGKQAVETKYTQDDSGEIVKVEVPKFEDTQGSYLRSFKEVEGSYRSEGYDVDAFYKDINDKNSSRATKLKYLKKSFPDLFVIPSKPTDGDIYYLDSGERVIWGGGKWNPIK